MATGKRGAMSFQKTKLNVSSVFHLEIKLTSSALDPEQRQSFQRRKVRNVEQWSLSVSTILEFEGRERGQSVDHGLQTARQIYVWSGQEGRQIHRRSCPPPFGEPQASANDYV